MISHHSSRVFVLKSAVKRSFIAGHCVRSICARQRLALEAGALRAARRRTAARSSRARRACRPSSRTSRRSARRCRAGSCRARRSTSRRGGSAWIIVISTAAPSTIAASTTWPLPERARSASAHATPNASSMPPPPKSPTRFSGGSGFSPSRPMWCERAGERDVVDVVARGLRHRAFLAPARHAAVRRAAGCARGRRRARGRAAPSRRGGSPRSARRPSRRAAAPSRRPARS